MRFLSYLFFIALPAQGQLWIFRRGAELKAVESAQAPEPSGWDSYSPSLISTMLKDQYSFYTLEVKGNPPLGSESLENLVQLFSHSKNRFSAITLPLIATRSIMSRSPEILPNSLIRKTQGGALYANEKIFSFSTEDPSLSINIEKLPPSSGGAINSFLQKLYGESFVPLSSLTSRQLTLYTCPFLSSLLKGQLQKSTTLSLWGSYLHFSSRLKTPISHLLSLSEDPASPQNFSIDQLEALVTKQLGFPLDLFTHITLPHTFTRLTLNPLFSGPGLLSLAYEGIRFTRLAPSQETRYLSLSISKALTQEEQGLLLSSATQLCQSFSSKMKSFSLPIEFLTQASFLKDFSSKACSIEINEDNFIMEVSDAFSPAKLTLSATPNKSQLNTLTKLVKHKISSLYLSLGTILDFSNYLDFFTPKWEGVLKLEGNRVVLKPQETTLKTELPPLELTHVKLSQEFFDTLHYHTNQKNITIVNFNEFIKTSAVQRVLKKE